MKGNRIHDRGKESEPKINFDDIPEITDFSKGVRGRHYTPGMSYDRVSIADDVVPYFPEDDLVNEALRTLIREGRTPQDIPPRPFTPQWIQRVSLDDDVARYFYDDVSVNSALRMLIDEGRTPKR